MNAPLSLSTDPYPLLLYQANVSSAGSYNSLLSGSSELGSVYPLSSIAQGKAFLPIVEKPLKYTFAQYMQKKKPQDVFPVFHCKVSLTIFSQKHAGQPFCILWFHSWVLRVGPDLQNVFWYFSAHAQPCLRFSPLQLHLLWCWSSHHQQTHSSYTIQALQQERQLHSHFSSMLFLLAL